jgi:hypothetical protein
MRNKMPLSIRIEVLRVLVAKPASLRAILPRDSTVIDPGAHLTSRCLGCGAELHDAITPLRVQGFVSPSVGMITPSVVRPFGNVATVARLPQRSVTARGAVDRCRRVDSALHSEEFYGPSSPSTASTR